MTNLSAVSDGIESLKTAYKSVAASPCLRLTGVFYHNESMLSRLFRRSVPPRGAMTVPQYK